MKYTPEQRNNISEVCKGRIIESMEWEPEGKYWVITFTDGDELCVRLMAELSE